VLRLLRRRRRRQLRQLAEAEVYARSYGERSEEVTNIKRVERVVVPDPEPESPPPRLTDRALRGAFLDRLARRRESH
jgi:hypothetical protein